MLPIKYAASGAALRNPLLPREAHLTVWMTYKCLPSWARESASTWATVQIAVPPPLPAHVVSPASRELQSPAPPHYEDADRSVVGSNASALRLEELSDRFVIRGTTSECATEDAAALRNSERARVLDGHHGSQPFELSISKVDGTIGPMVVGEQVVLEAGGGNLNLWRAPTDNDQGSSLTSVANPKLETIDALVWWYWIIISIVRCLPPWLFPPGASHADLWQRDGLDRLQSRFPRGAVNLQSASEGRIVLSTTCELRNTDSRLCARHERTITVLNSGAIVLENCADLRTVWSESLASVGLRFRLPRTSVKAVQWYGRGPHESYADRKQSAHVHRHEASAIEMGEELTDGYVYPQSCGQRSDVRWLALFPGRRAMEESDGFRGQPAGTSGLLIYGGAPMDVSLLPNSDEAIAAAGHPHELPADESVHLRIDHRTMGVGGDVGWLRSVRAKYLVSHGHHRWSIVLAPFTSWPPPRQAVEIPEDIRARERDKLAYEAHSWPRRLAIVLGPVAAVSTRWLVMAALLTMIVSYALCLAAPQSRWCGKVMELGTVLQGVALAPTACMEGWHYS